MSEIQHEIKDEGCSEQPYEMSVITKDVIDALAKHKLPIDLLDEVFETVKCVLVKQPIEQASKMDCYSAYCRAVSGKRYKQAILNSANTI